jgi:hypothetical protein
MKISKGRDPLHLADGTVIEPGVRVVDAKDIGRGIFAGAYMARIGKRIAMVRHFTGTVGDPPVSVKNETVYYPERAAQERLRPAV